LDKILRTLNSVGALPFNQLSQYLAPGKWYSRRPRDGRWQETKYEVVWKCLLM